MGHAELEFSALYSQHLEFVWRNLRTMGVPVADLEDATQDTFVVAYRRREDYRPDASMRAWLYGIARRVAYRHRRSGGRRARLARAVSVEPRPEPSLEAAAEDHQSWQLAMAALDRLPAPQREAYWLTEVEGLTAAEAGIAVGASSNTISSRLRAARQALARSGEVMRAREAGDLHRALRRGAEPSVAQRRRVLAALATPLSVGVLPVVASWAIGTAFAIAAVGVGAGVIRSGDTSVPTSLGTAHASPASVALEPQVRPPPSAPAVATPAIATPAVTTERPKPATTRMPRPKARPNASESTLADEAALVRRIKAAVEDDPSRALQLIGEHARRYPAGVLVQEAAALKVRTLCGLGRRAEASKAAETLPTKHVWATGCRGSRPTQRTTNAASSGEEQGT